MRVERNVSTFDQPAEVVEPVMTAAPSVPVAPVVEPVATVPVVVPEQHVERVRVASESTIVPAAGVAGVLAVALLVFGGVAMARAGFDGTWRDPVVAVGGFTATALLGVIVASSGLVLLIAALARAREAIMLFSIVLGVAALIAAIEPTVGDGALALERGFAVLIAIACGVVVLVATLVSSIRRTTSRVERI